MAGPVRIPAPEGRARFTLTLDRDAVLREYGTDDDSRIRVLAEAEAQRVCVSPDVADAIVERDARGRYTITIDVPDYNPGLATA
jgi:hypothetical protein